MGPRPRAGQQVAPRVRIFQPVQEERGWPEEKAGMQAGTGCEEL